MTLINILTIKDSVNVQISFHFACFSKGNRLWLLTTYAMQYYVKTIWYCVFKICEIEHI